MAKANLPNSRYINNLIHGAASNHSSTVEYRTWTAAKNRCSNPRNGNYANYGALGVTVCDRWTKGEHGRHPFLCFLDDMGKRPSSQHSLDRIDVTGNYEPSNCRWATTKEQCRNKRNNRLITYGDKSLTVPEWSEITGIAVVTLRSRLFTMNWSVGQALGFEYRAKISRWDKRKI